MTNETKHTPGPWEAVADLHGEIVIRASVPTCDWDYRLIAMIQKGDHAEANATLMAAAPALRDALQSLVTEMVCLFDLLNRQDPALLRKIERGQLETDNNLACQAARAVLASL